MQRKGIQFDFVHFEEARKTIAVCHSATNDWRPLHLRPFLLLQFTEVIFKQRNFLPRNGKTVYISFDKF